MRRVIIATLLMMSLLATPLASVRAAPAPDRAQDLLSSMTPEERVGQLFLVTVEGVPGEDSPIYDLIRRWRVSGVVLRADNNNFAAAPNTLESAYALVQSLQKARIDASAGTEPVPASGEPATSPYVPLLVGISLNREGTPYPELGNGLSEPVTAMALGATWDKSLTRMAGEQVGRELSDLGFNLILGPSLDVLEESSHGSAGDLGVETFGGDPFWVSEMGRAYVQGLHEGTAGHAAVIVKHFPGTGGSDRPPSDEVATIRKSLDSLRLVDLAPFFAVTSGEPGAQAATADGLLLSHIRYQGLQGNIRQTTRPVSLDRDALSEILSLETLPDWRAAGGLMITDSLGSRAVRRFYDPAEQSFNGPLVAREAFLAGSDMLVLDDFVSSSDPDQTTTIHKTLDAFVNRYKDDPVFAERVDEAVLRVLRLKLRLYGGQFLPAEVEARPEGATKIAASTDLAFRVARAAASRISPAGPLTPAQLGEPPASGERLVMFTDVLRTSQCAGCPQAPIIAPDALQSTITELYGPRAGGQARSWNLTSYSTADLSFALGERPPSDPTLQLADPEDVETSLDSADWLIFSLLSTHGGRYGADALKLLLERHPEQVQGKHVVVFAFDVPYELDATDLSKIDLLYALYAPANSFVNTAARLLFQELTPSGDSPVTVRGVGYDLLVALSPDPSQTIGLEANSGAVQGETGTPEAGFRVGDTIVLQTSTIVDHNGRPVPDGTPVQFHISYPGETLNAVLDATTMAGTADASVRLDRVGLHTFRASSDPARISDIVQIDVQEGAVAFATVIAPTPAATTTLPATDTAEAATTTPESGAGTNSGSTGRGGRIPFGAFVLAMILTAAGGAAAYLTFQRYGATRRDRFRGAIIAAIGVVLGYNYLVLGFPGSTAMMATNLYLAVLAVGVLGGAAGLAAAGAWWRRGWAT